MPYVALKWDHKIGMPMIEWIVLRCAEVGHKFGGLQALPPRQDVAYFVHPQTAEQDARAFAEFKESERLSAARAAMDTAAPRAHAAFEWDHNLFSPLIRWAVLQWGGSPESTEPRFDVAYFVDPETAERDAKAFSLIRDRRLLTTAM